MTDLNFSAIATPGNEYGIDKWEKFKKDCPDSIVQCIDTGKKYKVVDFRCALDGELFVGYFTQGGVGAAKTCIKVASSPGNSYRLRLIIEEVCKWDYVTDGVLRHARDGEYLWNGCKMSLVYSGKIERYGLCYKRVPRPIVAP